MTWNDLIDLAFVDLAVTQPGESITTAIRTDAQSRLNMLLSGLNAEGRTVFNQVTQTFSLSAGTAAYTLGNGGTFSTTGSLRAQKVTFWEANATNIRDGGAVLSLAHLGAVAREHTGDLRPIPKAVGADTAYPLINVRVSPAPSATPGTLTLGYWTPIAQISDFTAALSLPDGWPEMLHWNLALELFPQYARPGQTLDAIAAMAQNAKARLVDQNGMGEPIASQQQG